MKEGTADLPQSSQNALLRIARELRKGFTGRFEIECNQGGVRQIREVRLVGESELTDDAAA